MNKINSFDELKKLSNTLKPSLKLRVDDFNDKVVTREILVCGDTGCVSSDSADIVKNLNKEINKNNLSDTVSVKTTGCFGFCAKGPIVKIYPDNIFYTQVKPSDSYEIITEHIIKNNIVERLLLINPVSTKNRLKNESEIPFYQKQSKIALRNCGVINPKDLNEYIARDGYLGLAKCINKMTPEDVVSIVKSSKLRGRGGAGFPTGLKWDSCFKSSDSQKYVVCNADEGDPGAFMDRSILEGDPHSVLEAMAICGYAIGSNTGYIYIRAEYPRCIKRLQESIKDAIEMGLLGNNILGSDFSFNIELKYGAGAFVCGEGTALINSIEGKRGEPRMKTFSSSKKGLWMKPTCLNNVETLANIPAIINNGADWFKSFGTEDSPGTKVFALGGKINNVGLVEVQMGTTLREIVFDIGGGIPNERKFKAVQTGGPSGGCITESNLDTPIDFKSLDSIGSMMGSGGMLILDDCDCMVDIAKFFLEFTVEESCGKCTPCRIGNTRLFELLTQITDGKGTEEDLSLLKELSETIKTTSLCGLGKCAPNPVLSTLDWFMDEYKAHVIDKKCPAGKCQALLDYVITDACKGCTKCARICPAKCISGKVKEVHTIDNSKCLKCGACMDECKFGAIFKK